MNKRYIKIGAITLASLAVIYGGYRLVKHLIEKKAQNNLDPTTEETTATEGGESKFDADKIVSKGSKNNEVGAIQIALNNIIDDAKKGKSSDATKEIRRKDVASLVPLKNDNIFGDKTEKVLLKIMGKNSASYNEVKTKRIDFSMAYGLPNPYKK